MKKDILTLSGFKEHQSGLWVNREGEVFVPKTKGSKLHFTFGCPDRCGYLTVMYKWKSYRVHRLVAECFLPKPENLPEVNHKNEIKSDNRVENLEWCNHKYNMNYGTRNQRMAEKLTNGKCSKPVIQYDLDDQVIRIWPSAMEIKRELEYDNSSISACCRGEYKQMYGFKWLYKNEET